MDLSSPYVYVQQSSYPVGDSGIFFFYLVYYLFCKLQTFMVLVIMTSRELLVKNLSGTSEKLNDKNYLL